jgi:hypothetical protein
VIATVTDAILQKKPGPLVMGSTGLNEALHAVLVGYLGRGSRSGWATDDGKDKPVVAARSPRSPPILPDGQVTLFDPDMRTFQDTTQSRTAGIGNAAIKKGSQSNAQLKGSSGRKTKKAKAEPSKSPTVKPPRVPTSVVNNAPSKRKKPRPRIV